MDTVINLSKLNIKKMSYLEFENFKLRLLKLNKEDIRLTLDNLIDKFTKDNSKIINLLSDDRFKEYNNETKKVEFKQVIHSELKKENSFKNKLLGAIKSIVSDPIDESHDINNNDIVFDILNDDRFNGYLIFISKKMSTYNIESIKKSFKLDRYIEPMIVLKKYDILPLTNELFYYQFEKERKNTSKYQLINNFKEFEFSMDENFTKFINEALEKDYYDLKTRIEVEKSKKEFTTAKNGSLNITVGLSEEADERNRDIQKLIGFEEELKHSTIKSMKCDVCGSFNNHFIVTDFLNNKIKITEKGTIQYDYEHELNGKNILNHIKDFTIINTVSYCENCRIDTISKVIFDDNEESKDIPYSFKKAFCETIEAEKKSNKMVYYVENVEYLSSDIMASVKLTDKTFKELSYFTDKDIAKKLILNSYIYIELNGVTIISAEDASNDDWVLKIM